MVVADRRFRVRRSLELLVEEAAEEGLVRLDPAGRWCTARFGSRTVRRTLAGEVVVRRAGAAHTLTTAAGDAVHERVRALLARWSAQVEGGALLESVGATAGNGDEPPGAAVPGSPRDRLLIARWLARGATWTPERWRGERAHYERAYPEPVPVLPPDRARDLVVLPAVGCPHARCAFCTLHGDRRFRAFPDGELRERLEHLAAWLGAAVRTRSGVFLGSASALSLSQARLLRALEHTRAVLGTFRDGVAAFLDADHAPTRGAADYGALADAGLRHVTCGLESGDPALRRALGKSGDLGRLRRAVEHLGKAGLRRALTVLVGPGGNAARLTHRRATVALVRDLALQSTDRVFLSPLRDQLTPPTLAREELRALTHELRAATPARVAPYALDRFAHLA